jgi:hypothetical protein
MTASNSQISHLLDPDYPAGFVTDIDADSVPTWHTLQAALDNDSDTVVCTEPISTIACGTHDAG